MLGNMLVPCDPRFLKRDSRSLRTKISDFKTGPVYSFKLAYVLDVRMTICEVALSENVLLFAGVF
jgi:hypothetical protein